MTWILLAICLTGTWSLATGTLYMNICKWSNEGCTTNDDCCSKRCIQSHPGTNFRCARTDMGGLCLYSFHCGLRMDCGVRNRCCARHWATCVKNEDCCSRYQTCQQIKGFVYRKCLPRMLFRSSAHVHRQYLILFGVTSLALFFRAAVFCCIL